LDFHSKDIENTRQAKVGHLIQCENGVRILHCCMAFGR